MIICKYCGKPIEDEPVMNPDENGNGYHHYCLVDMEFKTRDKQIYDKGRADAFKWIPVSERLPEEEKDVLVCNANGDIEISSGSYSTELKNNDFIWYTSGWRFGKVIAWMPLPEPYKGD